MSEQCINLSYYITTLNQECTVSDWGLSSFSNHPEGLDPANMFSKGSPDSETKVIISWAIKNAKHPGDIL